MTTSLPSYMPEILREEIARVIGHDDYAPYVLDGQTAEGIGHDHWHDVLVVVDADSGTRAIKFTQSPNGHIEHHELHTQVPARH